MKKSVFAALAVSCCMLAAVPCLSAQPVKAADAPINILATKSDWSIFEANVSKFEMAGGELEIIPTVTDAGATYIAHSFKNAVIEFDYRLTYDEDVDPYNEEDGEMLPLSFWGVIFGNNVTINEKWTGTHTLPWLGTGGYPYMLAFDTERQLTDTESIRYTQVGLSLRRYKYGGSHSYAARWSTVDPAEGEYLCSNGEYAYSLVPEFSKPVKVSDCFDTEAHKVKIDYRAQYTSDGADKDAVAINVWFDEELVLTVIDEMPFKGESWGAEVDVDKRDKEGYVGIIAHHARVNSVALYDWKVNISNMKVTDLGAVNKNGADNKEKDSGCSSSVTGVWALAAVVPVIATAVVIKKKRGKV